jgi:uncharacterized protein Usg
MILVRKIVTVDVLYYMPDYDNILQEFIWQTMDIVPDIPRIHKFLLHWKEHIEAPISEVRVSYADQHSQRVAAIIEGRII